MKTAKKENIIILIKRVRLPLFNSFSFFTFFEKSPKLSITIEKYANIVPATVSNGVTEKLDMNPLKFKFSIKTFDVSFTSFKKTIRKNKNNPK